MTTTNQTNEQSGGGPLLAIAAVILVAALSGKPDAQPSKQPDAAPAVLGANAAALVARVRDLAKANPEAARKLGVMLSAAEQLIRSDTNGAAIQTTDHVFRYVERAERLYVTSTDGSSKLPGMGDAVSAVLKSPDVFGPTNGTLDPAKRRAGCDALKAIADELRGAR